MSMREDQLDQELEEKKLIIFGKDVAKIPCFRTSWLYGISSGIGIGILTFMFTSRARLASHVMVGSVCGSTFIIFTVCRYQYARDEYLANQLRSLMNDSRTTLGEERENLLRETQRLLKRDD